MNRAALIGASNALQRLLQSEADTELADLEGYRPLHSAAEWGHTQCVRLLLEHGAAVDARLSKGSTALMLAAEGGFQETAEILLKHGADLQATRPEGYSLLHFAAAGGHAAMFEWLLEQGVDPLAGSAKKGLSFSPLHATAMGAGPEETPTPGSPAEYMQIARRLLKLGLDVNAETPEGEKALTLAAALIVLHPGYILTTGRLFDACWMRAQMSTPCRKKISRSFTLLASTEMLGSCVFFWMAGPVRPREDLAS